uniref:Reverse transcriptase domain-containing protein n=1 Tax=Caenorhabditis japonica TaxID=281687 RepID=A0A8R1EGJ7_CAEJA
MKARKYVDVIYLDYAKAFDRVPHDILLGKLVDANLNPNLIKWIRSYLSNRNFSVKVNNESSTPKHAQCGVPQGAVLSPILFGIFVNEIPSILPSGIRCKQFADDIKIYTAIPKSDTIEDHETLMQSAIDAVCNWSENSKLALNDSKTLYRVNLNSGTFTDPDSDSESDDEYFDFGFGESLGMAVRAAQRRRRRARHLAAKQAYLNMNVDESEQGFGAFPDCGGFGGDGEGDRENGDYQQAVRHALDEGVQKRMNDEEEFMRQFGYANARYEAWRDTVLMPQLNRGLIEAPAVGQLELGNVEPYCELIDPLTPPPTPPIQKFNVHRMVIEEPQLRKALLRVVSIRVDKQEIVQRVAASEYPTSERDLSTDEHRRAVVGLAEFESILSLRNINSEPSSSQPGSCSKSPSANENYF